MQCSGILNDDDKKLAAGILGGCLRVPQQDCLRFMDYVVVRSQVRILRLGLLTVFTPVFQLICRRVQN